MSLSNYTENKILDHIVGKTSFTMPTVWIGLSTANPGETASGLAEPVAMAYARVAVAGLWAAAASGSISNNAEIAFVTATGSWGTLTHFALFDAETTGNMLWYGSLTQSKAIVSGDTAKFEIGSLVLTAD
jgi:hypothetical protein